MGQYFGQTPRQKPACVRCVSWVWWGPAYNPNAWEMEAEPGVQGQLLMHIESEVSLCYMKPYVTGWGSSSMIKHLPGILKVLGFDL